MSSLNWKIVILSWYDVTRCYVIQCYVIVIFELFQPFDFLIFLLKCLFMVTNSIIMPKTDYYVIIITS